MNKPILVAGLGLSGIQAAGLLLKTGKPVILYDGNTEKIEQEIRTLLMNEAEGLIPKERIDEVRIVLGELPDDVVSSVSCCVISPGISLEVPFAVKLKAAGVPILSEIELAWRYEKGRVIGITGTNGKTTTTTLVGDIMRAWLGPERAFTTGNIGLPYAKEVLKTAADSVTTIELSSFQLESIASFHPHVAAILNITPDHLNRHHTMECYAAVKERVTENQTEEDVLVLNRDDERLRAFGEEKRTKARIVWFSAAERPEDGYYLEDGKLMETEQGVSRLLLRTDEVQLVGQCNYENILAAIAMAKAMQVPEELILETVRNFKAVAHRIEFVEEIAGVRYYDDSKGTNPDAAVQAIKAMDRPTYLIGGGYDKGSEYDDWVKYFPGKVKKLVLIGKTAEKIAACCEKHGFTDYEFADSLEEAVTRLAAEAVPGEAVLLSPACASWDMFRSYEERGDLFKEYVRALQK